MIWPPPLASFRAQVDDPVGGFDHVQIVFNDDHRIAAIDQLVEHIQQQADIVEVKSGGRFVKQVERFARIDSGQLGSQFDALGFAAGKRGGGLPQPQDSPAPLAAGCSAAERWHEVLEEASRFGDRHFQHIGDRLVSVLDLQSLAIEIVPHRIRRKSRRGREENSFRSLSPLAPGMPRSVLLSH